jgi:hypothetical protein
MLLKKIPPRSRISQKSNEKSEFSLKTSLTSSTWRLQSLQYLVIFQRFESKCSDPAPGPQDKHIEMEKRKNHGQGTKVNVCQWLKNPMRLS